jgi:hypothetical protein
MARPVRAVQIGADRHRTHAGRETGACHRGRQDAGVRRQCVQRALGRLPLCCYEPLTSTTLSVASTGLPTFANILISLGVYNAINLDGGGSATFTIEGLVVNSPSDE